MRRRKSARNSIFGDIANRAFVVLGQDPYTLFDL
jgi:hypothetical protein